MNSKRAAKGLFIVGSLITILSVTDILFSWGLLGLLFGLPLAIFLLVAALIASRQASKTPAKPISTGATVMRAVWFWLAALGVTLALILGTIWIMTHGSLFG